MVSDIQDDDNAPSDVEFVSLESLQKEEEDDDLVEDPTADISPANRGELSESGSTPDPGSDDNALDNAHEVGEQLGDSDEGEGKRQEVDIARDVNEAEEYIRTH